VAWCKEQDNRGFPPRWDIVKSIALFLYGKRRGDKEKSLGKNCIRRFPDRHPDMASKFSTKLDRERAHASWPWLLRDYFPKLCRIIHHHNLKAFQIFNMDEKGFLIRIAARVKVIWHQSSVRYGAVRVLLGFPARAPSPTRSPDGSLLKQVGRNRARSRG